jgi:hypothetical protein
MCVFREGAIASVYSSELALIERHLSPGVGRTVSSSPWTRATRSAIASPCCVCAPRPGGARRQVASQRVAALMVSGAICYLLSVIRALIAVEAFTFFVGAALHLGVPVFGLDEPRILPAAIVEGLWGAVLGAAAIWYRRSGWRERTALVALEVATAGVLLGIGALAAGRGPSTPLDTTYHRVVLGALIGTGTLVVTTSNQHRSPSE